MNWARTAIAFEAAFVLLLFGADAAHGLRLHETVSDQVYGRLGSLVVASFLLHAVSLAALAAWRPRAVWPLAVGAVGMVGVAVFPTDPPGIDSWVGAAHIAFAVLAFAGVAGAALREWRRGVPRVLAVAVVATTLLLLAMVQVGGVPLGVVERAQVLVNGAWIVAAALVPSRASSPRDFSSGAGSAQP